MTDEATTDEDMSVDLTEIETILTDARTKVEDILADLYQAGYKDGHKLVDEIAGAVRHLYDAVASVHL